MPKIFDRVGYRSPGYSAFDLSHEKKLTAKMADLIPILVEEIVPGDQFRVRSEVMMRLAPMIAPVMHRVNCYVHYFFVPNRLVWNQWENFVTGGQEGTSQPSYPIVNLSSVPKSSLRDYMGLPLKDTGPVMTVSALPFRAYQAIWNDYYRDPNLADELDIFSLSHSAAVSMRKRAWEKDYFTSALPYTQRGPAVGVPLQTEYRQQSLVARGEDLDPGGAQNLHIGGSVGDGTNRRYVVNENTANAVRIENLADNTGIDINDLRKSSALQRWLEKQMRGGYRYIETVLTHFGVRSSDARLQRPEYLGGGRQPIVISEVLNTTGTEQAPQGDMAGHGISTGVSNSFSRRFEEHGYVLGIMSVLPRTAYQQGIPRHFMRRDKTDYYWPEFANLGEQEIKNHEIFYDPSDEEYSNGTFGYQQRYAEYKYAQSTVHGDFRDNLEFWHMGRIFDNQPQLNEQFVTADPTNRIFAVQEGDPLWIQIYNSVKARRPMPFFSNPNLS